MPPRTAQRKQLTRQYEHVKETEEERGHRPAVAKQNAAAIANRTRRMKGK